MKESSRLLKRLKESAQFLSTLVWGLEWTAANARGFGRPTISLEEDPEEGTPYILVEFPVRVDPVEGARVHRKISKRWAARAWQAAPVELCVTEVYE